MCVGLSAKVVKISNGTAVIDAGGAKREVSSQLLEDQIGRASCRERVSSPV